ncbi:MAG: hypothetical protein R3F23_00375 [Verrucomicrobiia bacterium]
MLISGLGKVIKRYYQKTDISGSVAALKQWYEQVKGRLVFDPTTRRFLVR